MRNKDFLYNLSRKGFKLRVNKMSANPTFCAIASAYVSKQPEGQKIGNKRKVVFHTSLATSVLTALASLVNLLSDFWT